MSSAGSWTVSQSTTVPSGEGFAYSQKLDCTTADASLACIKFFTMATKNRRYKFTTIKIRNIISRKTYFVFLGQVS